MEKATRKEWLKREHVKYFAVQNLYISASETLPSNFVDNVDNYSASRLSPTRYTSPAPIVINTSPCLQFSFKNFSDSSNVSK